MSEVTQLLSAIHKGDDEATAKLLPLVYEELRRLARARMAQERPEHTLQATALVHEAYLRLVDDSPRRFEGRGHFFCAAAEAMRRILVDHARSRKAVKRGGRRNRSELNMDDSQLATSDVEHIELLALDEALNSLAAESPAKAQLVKLRYFAGLSLAEAAEAMNISERTAKRYWVNAKASLFQALNPPE